MSLVRKTSLGVSSAAGTARMLSGIKPSRGRSKSIDVNLPYTNTNKQKRRVAGAALLLFGSFRHAFGRRGGLAA